MSALYSTSRQDLLGLYLNDHLLGASAGVELFRRSARSHSSQQARTQIAALAQQVGDDRDSLLDLMQELGVRAARHRMALGWLGEKAGRLKPNGSVLRRTPLTDLVELEYMRLGVQGKLACWEALEVVGADDDRVDLELVTQLQDRARSQLEELETLRLSAAENALSATAEGPAE